MSTEPLSSGGVSHAKAARVARAVQRGDKHEEADARRALAAHKIELAIERALEKAPPLSATQVKRLTGLLRGVK